METPFFLLYGRDPVLPNDVLYGNRPVRLLVDVNPDDYVDYKIALLSTLKYAFENISAKRDAETSKYKIRYDAHQKTVKFKIGDFVMVHWSIQKPNLPSKKLLPRWEGPFRIVARIGSLTYRIIRDDGKTFAIHVMRLRKYDSWPEDV